MDRLLKLADVKEMVALGTTTIYARMKAGTFPRPRALGEGCVRWLDSDVQAWMKALPVSGDGG